MENKLMQKIDNVNDEKVKLSNMFNDLIKQFDEKDVNEDIIRTVDGYYDIDEKNNCESLKYINKEIYGMMPARTFYNCTLEDISSPNSVFNISNEFINDTNIQSTHAIISGITLFFQNRINYLISSILTESEAVIYNWFHQCPTSVLKELNINSIDVLLLEMNNQDLHYNNNITYDEIYAPKFYSNLDMNKYNLAGRMIANTLLSLLHVNDFDNTTADITIMIHNYIVNRFVQIACQLNYEYGIIINNVINVMYDETR